MHVSDLVFPLLSGRVDCLKTAFWSLIPYVGAAYHFAFHLSLSSPLSRYLYRWSIRLLQGVRVRRKEERGAKGKTGARKG